MMLLLLAAEAVDRALALLEAAGPSPAPAHAHWLQARIHLSLARRELAAALEHVAHPGAVPVGG